MGAVLIRYGNIFDGQADLVIHPCSAKGTVSNWTRNHLMTYGIKPPPAGMKLGDLEVMPFPGSGSKAFLCWIRSICVR